MLERLNFFLQYSFNDLRANGRRTFFALLCIASGVAAIVSLQTLSVMTNETLMGSLQESNGGDIQIDVEKDISPEIVQSGIDRGMITSGDKGASLGVYQGESLAFTPDGITQLQEWLDTHFPGSRITYHMGVIGNDQAPPPSSLTNLRTGKEQSLVTSHIIDPEVYPLYGVRLTEEGQPLSEVLREPTDIVINRYLADILGAEVGDSLRLNYIGQDLELTGIVPDEAEGGFENIMGSLFGFYYANVSTSELFAGVEPKIDTVLVQLSDPTKVRVAETMIAEAFPFLNQITIIDLEYQNSLISRLFTQLASVMGMTSLLIGCIGIVNTMQVIVSRRIKEIAVLKTVGLQGEQVTMLFLVEAAMMGIAGSFMGILLGWLLAFLLRGAAGMVAAEPLVFHITPAPALTGFFVGVIVTTIAGFLPALAASQIRPKLVLQPNETLLPRADRERTFAVIIMILVMLGLVTQALIGDLLSFSIAQWVGRGAGAVLGGALAITMIRGGIIFKQSGNRLLWTILFTTGLATGGGVMGGFVPGIAIISSIFIAAGLLYVLLWFVIWIVGRFFPVWKFADLKIALRAMLVTRGRGTATMLALVIGVFSLSLLTMMAQAVTGRLEQVLVDKAGGNVIVWVAAGEVDTVKQVEALLNRVEGIHSYSIGGVYDVELLSLYDVSENKTFTFDELQQRIGNNNTGWPSGDPDELRETVSGIDARDVSSNLPDAPFYKGRQLTEADADQPYIVVQADASTLAAGFDVGDKLTFLLGDSEPEEITLEIVGMVDRTDQMITIGVTAPNYAPAGVFPKNVLPENVGAIIDIEPDQIGALRSALSNTPGVFLLETRLLNDVINRTVGHFSTFPILIAVLALLTGSIVIANSVALSTRERRREIGIMKAIGVQRERVVGMLLLEYGLMGMISGLLGVGIGGGILLVLLRIFFGAGATRTFPYPTALGLMVLCVVVAVLAAIVTAWGAAGEKPLHVLRYE